MVTKARMQPPIRADTAKINGEPQLLKKRLKTENHDSKRNDGNIFLYGGCINEN